MTDNGVNLAWDSLVSGGNGGNHPEKVKSINDQFYLGVAGYSRHSDVLHYASVPEVHPAEFEDTDFDARGYLVTQVIPTWLKVLKDVHGYDPETEKDWPTGTALIVIRGRVFTTDSIFAVTEHIESTGIGSGADYALGALAAGKSIEKAMQIACDLDPGTGGQLLGEEGVEVNWDGDLEDSKSDVNPTHYGFPGGVQVIDITRHLDFLRGNAVKYLCRAGRKGDELTDLRKAKQYVEWAIEEAERYG